MFTFCCIPFTAAQDMLWIGDSGTVLLSCKVGQNELKRGSDAMISLSSIMPDLKLQNRVSQIPII